MPGINPGMTTHGVDRRSRPLFASLQCTVPMLDLDTLDLKCLRAFHLVAKHGGLRVAAKRLKQTLPAISGKIRRLEKGLGFDLFERLPNRLVLTAQGEAFLREVDAVFERAEEALRAVSGKTPVQRLTISLGSDHAWFFAPRIMEFVSANPAVALSSSVYKSPEAIEALEARKIDMAFGIFGPLPKTLQRHVVAESSLSLAFNPKEFPGMRRAPHAEDMAVRRLIVPPKVTTTRRTVDKTLRGMIARAGSVIEAPTCETAAAFVEAGLGPAVIHTLCAARLSSRFMRTVELKDSAGEIAFSAVYRRDAAKSPVVKALLAHFR
jgi:DNA-binding transcriptional LysR family regulator